VKKRVHFAGLTCPANEEHGPLLEVRGIDGLLCPHIEHDGRPKTHPAGALAPTPKFFTLAQAERRVA
jgi:hypothetical protein